MARRQPGSSIKPYVYGTALDHGLTVDEMLMDARFCYPTASGTWCPENYRGPHTVTQYYGKVQLRMALALSLNSISVQLASKYGVEEVIRFMRALHGYARKTAARPACRSWDAGASPPGQSPWSAPPRKARSRHRK